MDGSVKHAREINPRANANFLSKLTFFFACTTFRKGYSKDFQEGDIYETLKSCGSTTLGDRLEKEWEREKSKKNPHIVVPLLRIFGLRYLLLGLLYLVVNTGFIMAKPLLKGKLVSYFSPNQTQVTQELAFQYGGTLIACIFTSTVFFHSYIFAVEQLSLRVKIATCSLIYRKSLKLSSSFLSKDTSGQAVTLITKDVSAFDLAMYLTHKLWVGIIQIMIMTYIMYNQIGVSAVIGSLALVLFIPLQGYLGAKTAAYRIKAAEKTDQRVKITQEILTAMRIIKMYTWELFFQKSVSALRRKEIRNLRILFYLKSVGLTIGMLNSRFALYICIMTYIALGNHITAEKAFIVTGCFGTVRVVMTIYIPLAITQIAEVKASLQRINAFLLLEEVSEIQSNEFIEEKVPKIIMKNVTVKTDQNEEVLEDVNLEIKPGLTAVTGTVGGGKSTLLKLLLGDAKKAEGIVDITGKMSYASQEPWLFPGTVKQNIVFGEYLDEQRYEAVVKVCALEKDFDAMPDRDRTCVTDKGLNLSRGQKCRINLARAVYKTADIYLLDDCLSAVDTHVGKHIFYTCIKGFLKNTMCIMVTHQEHFVREADSIIILSKGCVKYQGSYDNLKDWNINEFSSIVSDTAAPEVNESAKKADVQIIEKVATDVSDSKESTNLLTEARRKDASNIYGETKIEGSVSKEVYYTYFMSGGGVKVILLVVVLSIAAQALASWSDYFVSFWVDMEQDMSGFRFNKTTDSPEFKKLEASHANVMRLYSFAIFAATLFTLLRIFAYFTFVSRASTNIHNTILNNILSAAMTFFDDNLSGNVLNRFSRDLGIIDEQMPYTLFDCSRIALILFGILFVVSSVNPYFLIPSAAFVAILIFARRLYIPTSRSIRRLEGSTRSPLIGHFNATLEGLTTIRASQAQQILRKEFDRHQDLYSSAVYMHLSTTRAFGLYLDAASDFYVSLITLWFLLFETSTLAGRVGLAIIQAFSLGGLLGWGVRQWAELENQMTSTERVLEYSKVETEVKLGHRLSNWPHSGKIEYQNVSLWYSSASGRVLKDVSFSVGPKQKIGIVGRTGAGKTSIISTLFRMYEFRGTISIDDVVTNTVAVEFLRSKISIIPQDPVLFSGTIRSNLDPNEEYSDKVLWDALQEVEIKELIPSLSASISEGGSNFSVGQRQLICLARAIIRNNIILVLDEATANIDPQTDALIQKTIKRKFSDCTVITIAHRLDTIMDSDRVLVMDSGNAVEYDHPNVLLSNKNGAFYKMVKEAGLL